MQELLEKPVEKLRARHTGKAAYSVSEAMEALNEDAIKKAHGKPKSVEPTQENTSDQTTHYGAELTLNPSILMIEKLSLEHQKEVNDALEIVSGVLAGKSLEAAFLQVRRGVELTLRNPERGDSIRDAIDKTFEPHYGKDHLENVEFKREVSNPDLGTFVIQVIKLGKTALGRREVEGMLNGSIPKPVEYKDRQPVNGKKQKLMEFLQAKFGHLLEAKAIYAHELKALNSSLYNNLSATLKGGVSSLMPTKSEKVSHDIESLATNHAVAHRVLQSLYARN